MNDSANIEIFYSDDESDDGESANQDPDWQTSSALSYHPSPAHSNHLHQPLGQPPNPHHHQLSRQIINTPNKSGSNSQSMNNDSSKKQPFAIQSYSAAVRRAADAPQESSAPSRVASLSFASGIRSNKSKKNNNEVKSVCEKTTITATSAGFYFNHSKPSPDPRYPCQNQVMFGPVPCVLAHDILYLELRNILFQKGKIVNMFLHKNAIKMKESGKLVKYGYAVFEDSNVAERLLQQGNLAIADGVAVKISPMV